VKPKTAQLQIRVTATEKATIQRLAKSAAMDMSAYVLSRVLCGPASQFAECVEACKDSESASYGLAELNALLASLSASELRDAVGRMPAVTLTAYVANCVAAMVEQACQKAGITVPEWLSTIEPLLEPVFGSRLQSLRLYLLTHSPPPFRRRNIFIDSSLGDRV
jgi:hypothetical protein